MNIPFIVASSPLLLACIVHTVMGDREYRAPEPDRQLAARHFGYWLGYWRTGRSVFHTASMDLLP